MLELYTSSYGIPPWLFDLSEVGDLWASETDRTEFSNKFGFVKLAYGVCINGL
jgi:hypothetical protein